MLRWGDSLLQKTTEDAGDGGARVLSSAGGLREYPFAYL